jgi:hypothetical protein
VSRPSTALDGRGTVTTVTLNGVACCVPCVMVCAIPFVLTFLIVRSLYGLDVDDDGDHRTINTFIEVMALAPALLAASSNAQETFPPERTRPDAMFC